jgi:protein-tyrosine phosphatase
MGFWAGAWAAANKVRKQQGHPPLPEAAKKYYQREHFNEQMQGVIKELYEKTGKPRIEQLTWLEVQYTSLQKEVESIFGSLTGNTSKKQY